MKLREDEIKITKPGNILAKLFRKILSDRGLIYTWQDIVNKYISENNKKGIKGSTTHNIKADFALTEMSFNKFIFLLKNALNVVEFSITVKIRLRGEREDEATYHTLNNIKFKKDEEKSET